MVKRLAFICGIALWLSIVLVSVSFTGVEFDADDDGVFDSQFKVNQNNMVDGSALAEILDDDGSGSGLDADTVDGVELGSAANRDAEDSLTDGGNLPDGAAVAAYITAGQTGTTSDLSDGGWKLVDFMTFYAGENITLGYEVYAKYDTDRLKIYNYDADAADADTYFPVGIAPAAITSGNSGAVWVGQCLLMRRDEFTFTSADLGKPLWALTTAGYQSTTAPSSAGDHVNKLGTVVGVNGVNSVVGDYLLYRFSIDDTEVPTP
ncbi:MAG: hypothetical protein HGJ94_14060 [Desulfosarcina sp.]|nr:hypothetical protein [Desulfosarcina sp.]MBC2741544.1 hypothetical protein [Desulfosarcina sp.]MBC2764458.1 hypothetical protein [Desulfosarcina sp.]